MSISVLDLFKIGIGPSSSHTIGPMRAAHDFAAELDARQLTGSVSRIEARLYGSLSATGIGHGTDHAVIVGLMGQRPDEVDPDFIAPAVAEVRQTASLRLGGTHALPFHWDRDMRLLPVSLPYHPNALKLIAHGDTGVVYENTFYSIGGGFVIDEAQAAADAGLVPQTALRHEFDSAAELLAICKKQSLRISEVMLENELAWRSEDETRAALLQIWAAMRSCVARGIEQQGVLPGGLKVRRRAHALHEKLSGLEHGRNFISDTLAALDWVNLYALAVNEENAGGGRVVTAPTNGAAGIIPAVLHYYMNFHPGSDEADVVDFLLTAAAIGTLCKKNASISGAEVGCQGEVGSACAMAAAGLTQIMGGTPEQVENAAEIGLEHNLGLTCDPVAGLVQLPCIERNAMASIKAINAAQLALRGDGSHAISLDQVIRTMRDTGRDMLDKYKETSRGGLAVNFTEC
ncbi:L-serine ammonia-lyase [Parazoarcus communis]|uniref:L-serine dehydratase n=1 Tax=Parazoarcus communis TaxID=41977 RepID=A0A2U8GK88_9RHOO|nr:L-serine ammonia-lyase [Parazoarcus communis]AWI73917.1 L-serine ammonia-lyase [Parazoarcus communis]TVT54395.1 MAG: L-serine ammonia-lyase [Azoarcus sp. PHD]